MNFLYFVREFVVYSTYYGGCVSDVLAKEKDGRVKRVKSFYVYQ